MTKQKLFSVVTWWLWSPVNSQLITATYWHNKGITWHATIDLGIKSRRRGRLCGRKMAQGFSDLCSLLAFTLFIQFMGLSTTVSFSFLIKLGKQQLSKVWKNLTLKPHRKPAKSWFPRVQQHITAVWTLKLFRIRQSDQRKMSPHFRRLVSAASLAVFASAIFPSFCPERRQRCHMSNTRHSIG